MALLATASELASYLQKDLDTATAELVLAIASARFARDAERAFTPTTATYVDTVDGSTTVVLPYQQVTAVSEVRINGAVITGWSLRNGVLYRTAGFGYRHAFPPDEIAVDLTHGETAVPDDVKGAVLETAAQAYEVPVGAVIGETIDDYAIRYATTGGGLQLTPTAADLAAGYRGALIA
jgi:hypothetical protein